MGGLPWLKLDVDAATHPKVLHLETLLGIPDAFGIVCRLWSWTSKYAGDGLIPNKAKDQMAAWVARGIQAASALDAMVEAGCLDRRKDGLVVHGWSEYQGEHVKFRERNTERQRKLRERNALLTRDTTVSNASVTRAEERRGEERREEKKKDPAPAAPGAAVWEAYSSAYQKRYGALPVRNQKVNTQFVQLVSRLAAEEAPDVARFYLGHNGSEYVRKMHSVGMLLIDCEKLRTEWVTGRKVTATAAKHSDEKQETIDGWNNLRRVSNGLE